MKRGDFLLIIFLFIVAGGWLLWPGASQPAATATVSVDGSVTAVIDLSQDGLYPVQGLPGTGLLEVRDGSIRMQPMAREICPQGICCRITGWIDRAPQSIVCLPNRIVVSLSQAGDVDY